MSTLVKVWPCLTWHWHQISFTWRLSSVSLWVNSWGALERHQEPKTETLLEKGPRKSRVDLSSNCSGILLPNRTTHQFRLAGPSCQRQQFGLLQTCVVQRYEWKKIFSGNKSQCIPTVGTYFTTSDQSNCLWKTRWLKFKMIYLSFFPLFSEGDHRDDPPLWRSLF